MAQLNIFFSRGEDRGIYTQTYNREEVPDFVTARAQGAEEYPETHGWSYSGYDYLPNDSSETESHPADVIGCGK